MADTPKTSGRHRWRSRRQRLINGLVESGVPEWRAVKIVAADLGPGPATSLACCRFQLLDPQTDEQEAEADAHVLREAEAIRAGWSESEAASRARWSIPADVELQVVASRPARR